MVSLPIDNCLQEIGKGYRPGMLAWLKGQPGRWKELLALESRINEVALSNQDETILKDVLSDYREFFEEMTTQYIMGDGLFEGKRSKLK